MAYLGVQEDIVLYIYAFYLSCVKVYHPSNQAIQPSFINDSMIYVLQILIQSVCETMVPKLVAEDIPLLFSLLSDVFPGIQYRRGEMEALRNELRAVCRDMYLVYGDGEEVGGGWVEKVSDVG